MRGVVLREDVHRGELPTRCGSMQLVADVCPHVASWTVTESDGSEFEVHGDESKVGYAVYAAI
jgi:hypothetical protein